MPPLNSEQPDRTAHLLPLLPRITSQSFHQRFALWTAGWVFTTFPPTHLPAATSTGSVEPDIRRRGNFSSRNSSLTCQARQPARCGRPLWRPVEMLPLLVRGRRPPAFPGDSLGRGQDLILPVAIIASVLVIMVPLPAALMDVLLAANITRRRDRAADDDLRPARRWSSASFRRCCWRRRWRGWCSTWPRRG